MEFDKAIESIYDQEIDKIVKDVLSGANRCIIGLNHCAREFVYKCVVGRLRSREGVLVLESAVPLGVADEGDVDPCCSVIDRWLSDLGQDEAESLDPVPKKIKLLLSELERTVSENKRAVLCLRDFGNVRYVKNNRLAGFLQNLLKVNENSLAGYPRIILESSRGMSLLQSLCPQVYETTSFVRMFPIRSHVWIQPLTQDQIVNLFRKTKHKYADRYVVDVFQKTMGAVEPIRRIVDGASNKELSEEFGVFLESIRKILADFPCAGESVQNVKRTMYDELVSVAKGNQPEGSVLTVCEKYGLFLPGTIELPEVLKNGLLSLGGVHCSDQDRTEKKEDPHYLLHRSFPDSTLEGYDGRQWMHVGRFLIKKDWTEVHLFHDRAQQGHAQWKIKSARSSRGRGVKERSDNDLGIALLSYFMKKYYENLGRAIDPEMYYESAPIERCGNQGKSPWRKYMVSSPGLKNFFQSQMWDTKGKKGAPCWGIMPDDEWIRRLDGLN